LTPGLQVDNRSLKIQKKLSVLVLVIVILGGCSAFKALKFNQKYGPAQSGVDRIADASAAGEVSFYDDVQPILDRRCSVCHSCYDAPCQLKTTCFEGIDRGGTKALVYATRLTAAPPTRLHIDADSAEGWRELGFHPVLNERDQIPVAHLENSVLNLMLQLKKDHPIPRTDLLPETFDIRLNRDYICTTVEDFDDYKKKYPLWGMPYALPGGPHHTQTTVVGSGRPAHRAVGGILKWCVAEGTVDVSVHLRAPVHRSHPFSSTAIA